MAFLNSFSGVPASGKSSFGESLKDKHNYLYIDMENSPWPDERLHTIWDLIFQHVGDDTRVEHFVEAVKTRTNKAVLDLGFPTNDTYFWIVPLLKKFGCRVIWFHCDEKIARQRYLARDNRPVEPFDIQMKNIKQNWKRILNEINPEVISVLKANDQEKTFEEVYSEVF